MAARSASARGVAQGGEAEGEIGGRAVAGAAQRVAGLGDCGEVGGERGGAVAGGFDEHVGQAGMDRQGGEGAAVGGDAARGIEGAEVGEEGAGLGEGRGGRRRQEGEAVGARGAPGGEFEGEAGEVGAGDLGRGEGGEGAFLAAGPEAVAPAGGGAAGAAAALLGLGAGDALGDEAGHAGAGIVAGAAGAAGVDDEADVGDRQRRFGDGGGEDEPAALRQRREGGALLGEGQAAVQRLDDDIGRQARGEAGGGAGDLGLAGEEDERAAFGLGEGLERQAGDGLLEPGSLPRSAGPGAVEPAGLDRMGAAFGGQDGRVVHQRRDGGRVEGGGHDEEQEVRAQGAADLQGKRQAEVGVQRALVEFVEDHATDAGQVGRGLEHPRQDAFGHDLDAGARHRLAADAVADLGPDAFAEAFGEALGGGAGGDAARLEQEDAAGKAGFEQVAAGRGWSCRRRAAPGARRGRRRGAPARGQAAAARSAAAARRGGSVLPRDHCLAEVRRRLDALELGEAVDGPAEDEAERELVALGHAVRLALDAGEGAVADDAGRRSGPAMPSLSRDRREPSKTSTVVAQMLFGRRGAEQSEAGRDRVECAGLRGRIGGGAARRLDRDPDRRAAFPVDLGVAQRARRLGGRVEAGGHDACRPSCWPDERPSKKKSAKMLTMPAVSMRLAAV